MLFDLSGVGRLEDVPGVGGRVAGRLREYFGGDEAALRAIGGCRVGLLVEAVGGAAAGRILHGVYRLLFGRWPRSLAFTDDSWHLFTLAREVLSSFTLTGPGRDIVSCALPSPEPSRAPLRALFSRGYNLAPRLRPLDPVLGEVSKLLDWPRPVVGVRVNRLLIVVGDHAAYRAAVERFSGMLRVEYAEDGGDVEGLAEGFEDVVVYDPYNLYQGPLPRAYELTLEEVVPEARVEFFRRNWRPLKAVAIAASKLGSAELASLSSLFNLHVSPEDVERLVKLSELLEGGEIAWGVDEEFDRLRRAYERLEEVVSEVEAWLNDKLRTELERLEVRLPARRLLELLSSLRRGEPPPPIEPPEELLEAYTKLAREALERIAVGLGLERGELELLEGLVPPYPSYPVEFDRTRLDDLRSHLRLRLAERRLNILRTLAEAARGLEEPFERLVQFLAEADAALAPLRLAGHVETSLAVVEGEGLGVAFRDAVEAELLRGMISGRVKVQPVSYIVGDVDEWRRQTRGERIVLLTGANSGGKTTLLKTIAETVLLAHAGLPAYARQAWTSKFDTVVFISKPSGEVGAGALEAMLRSLAQIASAPGRKLLLVDELEAATEAGAASKLLAGFIEYLAERGDTVAVIVSHLADSIISALNPKTRSMVRVDGIEAVGLDKNYNLIVDRNPKYYYHAKSTPELVVSKLLATARDEDEKKLYKKLLEKLKE